ncbi:MAG: cysteine--tRNA ligase [Candidatus Nanoarchaeia archaeon]
MDIFLTNTLGRKKAKFEPLIHGKVGIYTCGPTVYNYAHIGNLRAYVFADILKRVFLFNKYKVEHVMNITDVGHLTSDADEGEDKLEKGAAREGKTVWEVAKFYTEEFMNDSEKMRILTPNTVCKATDHIPEMISTIQKIEQNGFSYISEGNVYFDTSKLEDYGKLKGGKQSDEDLKSRVGKDLHKKNQTDFVLWFTRHKHGNHAMIWDSPWGEGFPGWHIECSAMSTKYLGQCFDIHTGGIDHIPIHHTNELAQNVGAFGEDSVNWWLHSEFLVMSGEDGKMSKATGEFLRLKILLDKGYTAEDYRYFLLGTHYRKNMQFSFAALDGAKNTMEKIRNKILELRKLEQNEETEHFEIDLKERLEEELSEENEYDHYIHQFNSEINDDLNTPKALATLWEVFNDDELEDTSKLFLAEKFDEVFGLGIKDMKETKEQIPEEILKLKHERDNARKNKEWKKSDELRDLIQAKGYKVQDVKEESEVRKL